MDTTKPLAPDLLGCGSVLFPTDDCLASVRRQMRRQRRHIRATRVRIARLKQFLLHLGVLNQTELDQPGGPWPWKLAARVLAGGDLLSWPELWDVLRWYAHNRGYDGNRNWSGDDEENPEDTEKVTQARSLMETYATTSMCATICAKLGVSPLAKEKSSSHRAYKTSNAAFPRDVITEEVRAILARHEGHLTFVTPVLIEALCASDNRSDAQHKTVRDHLTSLGFDARLPGRYVGGLLFGQAVPRFDNRIIGICPVSGDKKPLKDCREFLDYRWAMVLANVRVRRTPGADLEPLTAAERAAFTEKARIKGDLTAKEFQTEITRLTGSAHGNVEAMLTHPDAQMALILDPVLKLTQSSQKLKDLWPLLPAEVQKRALGRWRKGRRVTLDALLQQVPAPEKARALLDKLYADTIKRVKKKESIPTKEAFLRQPLRPDWPSGRAPFSRAVMRAAYEQVMQATVHPMEEGGALFITEEMKQRERDKDIDQLTNNHLVRHRLKILLRLVEDMVKTYADNDPAQVQRCVIEVARDLVEYSGLTNKEIAQEFGIKLKNFKDVSKKLVNDLEATGVPLSAGLIRKGRIADDLDWTCPYTLKKYDAMDLAKRGVDKDHIIPRSQRASDSLDSLVITFPEVNRMKGNRTGLQFIKEFQGRTVEGRPELTICTEKQYLAFVGKLAGEKKPTRFAGGQGSLDDKLRQWNRKQRLLLEDYEEQEFTPRDLTVTSHLVRLAARQMEKRFAHLRDTGRITSLPGSVTGEVRKAWKVLGCMAQACPEIMQEIDDIENPGSTKRVPKPKSEIRDITHLHHALDACVMGYAALLLPNNGKLWQQLLTRKVLRSEQTDFSRLHGSNPMLDLAPWNRDKPGTSQFRLTLRDLPTAMKNQMTARLLERRVVQHVPADMSGARLEQLTWGVASQEGNAVILQQRTFNPKDNDPDTGARKRTLKNAKEKPGKLLGLQPGKLKQLKGALVISENYGVALDPVPTIIPFHQVKQRLLQAKELNEGKPVRVLRNGMLISVPEGKYAGVWRVRSCKDNAAKGLLLDLTEAQRVSGPLNKVSWSRCDVLVKSLLGAGMQILDNGLCGVAAR